MSVILFQYTNTQFSLHLGDSGIIEAHLFRDEHKQIVITCCNFSEIGYSNISA